jgi:hypothetical protein
LSEFVKVAKKDKAETTKLRAFSKAVATNSFSTLDLPLALPTSGPDPSADLANEQSPANREYVPIGVWVTNWTDIFTWLATGHSNGIDDTSDAETIVKFRMMQQDFLTLSRLYRYAANCNLEIPTEPRFTPKDLVDIAQSFARKYDAVSRLASKPANYAKEIKEAVGTLDDRAEKIYRRWDEIKFLRNAELGLGVLVEEESSADADTPTRNMDGIVSLRGASVTSGNGFPQYSKRVYCGFRSSRKNYDAFARFYKVFPLLLPSGRVLCFGPGNGILCTVSFSFLGASPSISGKPFIFSRVGRNYTTTAYLETAFRPHGDLSVNVTLIEFVPNLIGGYLENDENEIKLYPIPFSAASGIEWKGQSFSTNVGADEDLNVKLGKLVEELQQPKVTKWSYSSDNLPDGWNGKEFYKRVNVRQQYFGLIKEPKGT